MLKNTVIYSSMLNGLFVDFISYVKIKWIYGVQVMLKELFKKFMWTYEIAYRLNE